MDKNSYKIVSDYGEVTRKHVESVIGRPVREMSGYELMKRLIDNERDMRGTLLEEGCNLTKCEPFEEFQNYMRTHYELGDIKERRIDFGYSKLNGVNAEGIFLPYVTLSNSELQNAILRGANLERAYFLGSNCTGADFTGANLEGASFSRTNLAHAKLNSANLSGTDFYRAELHKAELKEVDLREINGLLDESVRAMVSHLNTAYFGNTMVTKSLARTLENYVSSSLLIIEK